MWGWYGTIYLCCYKYHCKNDGSCVVGYVGMVVYLGVVGGPRVKLIGCGLRSLWLMVCVNFVVWRTWLVCDRYLCILRELVLVVSICVLSFENI